MKPLIIIEGEYDVAKMLSVLSSEKVNVVITGGFNLYTLHVKCVTHLLFNDSEIILSLTDPDDSGIMIENKLRKFINFNNKTYIDVTVPHEACTTGYGEIGIEQCEPKTLLKFLSFAFNEIGLNINDYVHQRYVVRDKSCE